MASELLFQADRLVDDLVVVIEAQRAELQALRALAQSRGDDAATLRQALRACLRALHDELIKRQKAEASHARLVAEYRRFRERTTSARSERAA